jgi:hypothetical protein
MKPDFICIGAQKAGTTWLYQGLSELEGFSLPYIKELHYFDRDSSYPAPKILTETYLKNRIKNKKWIKKRSIHLTKTALRGNLNKFMWLWKWYMSTYEDSWYLSLFKNFEGITGDISPAYSVINEYDINRMYCLMPNVKLVFLLRNPIDRAWSNFRFNVSGSKTILRDQENPTIEEMITFFETEGQLLRSDYLRTIELYSKYFDTSQIFIGFYDEIINNPRNLLTGLVRYLGGDVNQISNRLNLSSKINASPEMKIPEQALSYLKIRNAKMIKEMSDRFGGYCSVWYNTFYDNSISEMTKTKGYFILSDIQNKLNL